MQELRLVCQPSILLSWFNEGLVGFDRLMSILCNERSIRNVIAFPKTAGGIDLLFKSPAPIPTETLALYGLQASKAVGETS
jgi:aspartyl-tRNA synthetase